MVGLEAEARIARELTRPELVVASGATAAGVARAVAILRERGAGALMSFGLAAGLDPRLQPGTLLVPRTVRSGAGPRQERHAVDPRPGEWLPGAEAGELLHAAELVAEPREKAQLFADTGCVALDMESGVVGAAAAAMGVPFLVLRAVCDPADRALPPAARLPLGAGGRVAAWRVAESILRRPAQVPELVRLGRDAGRAMRALRDGVRQLSGRIEG